MLKNVSYDVIMLKLFFKPNPNSYIPKYILKVQRVRKRRIQEAIRAIHMYIFYESRCLFM